MKPHSHSNLGSATTKWYAMTIMKMKIPRKLAKKPRSWSSNIFGELKRYRLPSLILPSIDSTKQIEKEEELKNDSG